MADYVVRPTDGLWGVAPGTVVTFWDSITDGTQYTDLLDALGAPITQVTTDTNGFIPSFSGPVDVPGMWADAGGTSRAWIAARDGSAGPSSNIGRIQQVIKALDTPRSNTASPAADPHLTLPVEANATYDVELIGVWSNGGGGLRATWAVPVGTSMVWTDNDGVGVTTPAGVVTFTATTGTCFKGTLVVADTAGALTLLWAQNTSNAAATILRAGCSLKLVRTA
ncbi:hypothetical protein L0F81_02825 [Streptomyces tricolor]|uniref:Minor tail protein n=1 Tax=Streptomyces tricolor TaxID=68277 RepID=A0ABS9J9J9_9ACTN|nr:hypothetical protein [Streptomyces tricolor]MCG0062230.1 hypothetical protein [Streptomyces tricolor]